MPSLPPTETHYSVTCKIEKDWWDKFKPFVEIAGVLLLLAYTFYTIKMYHANRDAAKAATSAAETAHDALTIGQSSERAWMLFEGVNLLRPLVAGQPILAEYKFKNTGHTPALGVRAGANFYIWKGDGEPDPTVYFNPQFPGTHIGSGDPLIGQINYTDTDTHRVLPLSAEEWRDIQRGPNNAPPKRVLFMIGAVEYVDIFQVPVTPKTVPRYSNFCAQFLIDATGGGMFIPAKCRIQIR